MVDAGQAQSELPGRDRTACPSLGASDSVAVVSPESGVGAVCDGPWAKLGASIDGDAASTGTDPVADSLTVVLRERRAGRDDDALGPSTKGASVTSTVSPCRLNAWTIESGR